ncbi:MAG: thioredoxin family protein, partial [Planctomycetes bacterium]|nr:thioredoxin family protein [Planctomycetota bacterium]
MKLLRCEGRLLGAGFVVAIAWSLATTASGQLTPPGKSKKVANPASVSARITPATAKPGDTVNLEVTAKLDPGYHTYDVEQPELKALATQIILERTDPLRGSGRWTGTPVEEKNDELLGGRIRLHETSPTWSQAFKIPADAATGRYTIAGKVRFQVCNDKTCLPLEEKFEAALEIKSGSDQAPATKTNGGQPERHGKAAAGKKTSSKPAAVQPNPKHFAKFAFWAEPAKIVPGGALKLHVQAQVDEPWHIYSNTMKQAAAGPRPTVISLNQTAGLKSLSEFRSDKPPTKSRDPDEGTDIEYHEGEVTWTQVLKVPKDLKPGTYTLKGSINHMLCKEGLCLPPLTVSFDVAIEVALDGSPGVPEPARPAAAAVEDKATGPKSNGNPSTDPARAAGPAELSTNKDRSLAGFLLLALGTGFGSILTPCVFPMIPITVGFFLKQAQARRTSPLVLAAIYSLTIIGVYTLLGVFLGTAFLALGRHPLFNLAMAALLGILGLALMGVFELRMPSFLVQFTSSREAQGGLVGVVFMALTFVIVSTPCTGPFVGTVLTWSSQGERTWPIMGLITYSTALASPFFVLALVPGLLSTLPRGGGWLNTFKTTIGFVVLATTFYFLVKADLGLQTGLLTRSVVLAVWAAMGLAAGLYLAGLVRLAHDGPSEGIGAGRLQFAIVFFALGFYFASGLFGQQLNSWIEAMLPQDDSSIAVAAKSGTQGLSWGNNSLDEAIQLARTENRPVFVDFTGETCVNCKQMEHGIFQSIRVVERFRQMVLAKLYTDRERPDDEANKKLEEERFGTVGIPYYVVLSPDGRKLGEFQGRAQTEQEFLAFLDASLEQWAAIKPAAGQLAALSLPTGNGNGTEIKQTSGQPDNSPEPSPESAKFWKPFNVERFTEFLADGRNLVVDWTA